MKSYSQIYALFLMFVCCTSCKGPNKTDLPKENIKTKDIAISPVPKLITRNIIQDRKGNIWMAAFDGIFRYDGKSFTNITSKVSTARFFSVLADRKGNFWFGSIGSGVYYYDGKSFRNFTTKEGLAGNGVTCIYEDKTGNIWFGTGDGVSRYDGKSFRNFTTKDGLSNNDVNAIIEDTTGKFWFGTWGNACFFDGKTFTVFTHEDKPFMNVRSIIEDKKGNIWLGGKDGLWRYSSGTFTNFTENFTGYVYEDKEGDIWISSESDQDKSWTLSHVNVPALTHDKSWTLSRYDEKYLSDKRPIVTIIKPNKGMICGILEANDGRIWFGASEGVYCYNGNTVSDFKGIAGRK